MVENRAGMGLLRGEQGSTEQDAEHWLWGWCPCAEGLGKLCGSPGQASTDLRLQQICVTRQMQQLRLAGSFGKRCAGAGEESPGHFLGSRALITEEAC